MQWLKRRWKGMMNRCYYQKDISYPRYGGRGIEVCDEWHDFNTFSQWCQSQPGFCRENQIDRIDNDGSYSPSNCKFVAPAENARNRSDNVKLTAFGETKTIAGWLEDPRCLSSSGILYSQAAISSDHEALITTRPKDFSEMTLSAFGETKTLGEWTSDPRCSVNRLTLKARVERGWDSEEAVTAEPNSTRKGKFPHNSKTFYAFGESKLMKDWIADPRSCVEKSSTIWCRLDRGWDFERALATPPRPIRQKVQP